MAIVVAALAYVGKLFVHDKTATRRPGEPFTGSWWFPRGGPYILGFDSPAGPARLEIDGQPLVEGAGERQVRRTYSPGVHAVTFDAPAGARLLWHPPGRRGALEYVPASSLSTQPPELATFTAPGSDIGAALVATGILLVIVFGALVMARPIVHGRGGPGTMIFVIALVVRLYGLGDAGQTWDEDEYWSSGRNYVVNVLAHDASPAAWRWNFQHPPLTKYIAGVGALWMDGFAVSRVLFALMGAGTCVLAFSIGRRLFSTRVGAFAGTCAALMPPLIAHSRIIGHETPSAFLWSLAVWLALRVNDPHNRDEEVAPLPPGTADIVVRLAAVGLAVGLAAATRYTNLLVAPLVGALVLLTTPRERLLKTAGVGLVVAPIVAVGVFVAIWPLMWHDPVANIRAGYDIMRQQHLAEPYLGKIVQVPPWHYFPVYLAATTPIVLLVAAFVGGGVRAALLREKGLLLLLLWLAAPFGVAFSPVKQDGVRYILPALPALAVAAAAGIDLVAVRSRSIFAALGLVLGLVAYLGFTCLRIQPYYLDYFGEHVGGPAAVQRKHWFEVGWWGEGLADAVDYVNAHAGKEDIVARLVIPTHVTWFREDLWDHLQEQPGPAHWYVVNDMWELERGKFVPPLGVALVYQVEAEGASLVRVYHRD
jgi:4-amino-4-deoxy-L-arabinose transferase-like glycosyltransferase